MNRRKPLAVINITPLVDVLLILLVVLMLAMPFFAKKMPVDLPHTSLEAVPTVKHTLRVALRENGELLVEDKATERNALLQLVGAGTSIEIYPDSKASYASIAKLVSDLEERHPSDVSLMTN